MRFGEHRLMVRPRDGHDMRILDWLAAVLPTPGPMSGAGWVEFDPTNRIVASRKLIRVASTRTLGRAMPVSGSFVHDGGAMVGLQVAVRVTAVG